MHSSALFPLLARALCAGAAWFISMSSLGAHGDDKALFRAIIQALTEELAKAPEADLLIHRGELYRHLQDWANADADFTAAAKLAPERVMIGFLRARALLELGAPEKARPFAESYLNQIPEDPEAWFLHGEIKAVTGNPKAASADYAAGLRCGQQANPDQLLRWTKLLASLPQSDLGDVLAILDKGIVRLGPLDPLVKYAIDLEVARKNYDAALARIASAMRDTTRLETWLMRQGNVLANGGHSSEAITAYREALSIIEKISPRKRTTTEVEALTREARDALNQLLAK
jgi:predicted Zn-dependent protease